MEEKRPVDHHEIVGPVEFEFESELEKVRHQLGDDVEHPRREVDGVDDRLGEISVQYGLLEDRKVDASRVLHEQVQLLKHKR